MTTNRTVSSTVFIGADPRALPLSSTNMVRKYLVGDIIPTVQVRRGREREDVQDWMNASFARVFDGLVGQQFKGLIARVTHVYKGEPMPSISFRYYGTTSLTWLIMGYNGILDEFTLPNGFRIAIPDSNLLDQVLASIQAAQETESRGGSTSVII